MALKRIFTIDAETDPFDGTTNIKPFIWDIFDGVTHYTMESVKDCHHFIEKNSGTYFAHNGGKFDYHLDNFSAPIKSGDEVLIINGRLARFKMLGSEFRDSYCILPSPLSKIGGKLEIDYSKLSKANRKKHMAEIITYLHADTEALYKAVTAFREGYGNGITLAGCAIKQLQKIERIDNMPRLNQKDDADLRGFYFGGRVESFASGIVKRPFTVYDVVSAYPAAMLQKHGWGNYMHDDAPRPGAKVIKQAFYDIQAVSDGAFPVRDRTGIHFPYGEGNYKVTGWELQAALDAGVVKVLKVNLRKRFMETVDFKQYIYHFFALKAVAAEGSPERLHAKLFLNSAYGKLGCNPRDYCTHVVCDPGADVQSYRECGYETCGWLGGRPLMSIDLLPDEWRFLHVGAAASVTGCVRAQLLTQMCQLRAAGGKVLYCDTDSITVEGATMETGAGIGEWCQEAECVEGAFAGKKMYALKTVGGKWKTASKGVRLTPAEIYRVAKGETVEHSPLAPSFGVRSAKPRMQSRKVKATHK